jgi:hypothetical protein
MFEDANQLTRFVDDGVAYSLATTPGYRVAPVRPKGAARLARERVFV